jgi:hypothetical protein
VQSRSRRLRRPYLPPRAGAGELLTELLDRQLRGRILAGTVSGRGAASPNSPSAAEHREPGVVNGESSLDRPLGQPEQNADKHGEEHDGECADQHAPPPLVPIERVVAGLTTHPRSPSIEQRSSMGVPSRLAPGKRSFASDRRSSAQRHLVSYRSQTRARGFMSRFAMCRSFTNPTALSFRSSVRSDDSACCIDRSETALNDSVRSTTT